MSRSVCLAFDNSHAFVGKAARPVVILDACTVGIAYVRFRIIRKSYAMHSNHDSLSLSLPLLLMANASRGPAQKRSLSCVGSSFKTTERNCMKFATKVYIARLISSGT
jgi:hypothetical protein